MTYRVCVLRGGRSESHVVWSSPRLPDRKGLLAGLLFLMLVCMVWLQMSRPGLDVDRAVAERHLEGPMLGASLSPPPLAPTSLPTAPRLLPLPYSSALPDWGSSVDGAPPTKCVFLREAGSELKEKRTFTKACVIGERHSGTNFVSSACPASAVVGLRGTDSFATRTSPHLTSPHLTLTSQALSTPTSSSKELPSTSTPM